MKLDKKTWYLQKVIYFLKIYKTVRIKRVKISDKFKLESRLRILNPFGLLLVLIDFIFILICCPFSKKNFRELFVKENFCIW